MNKVYILIGVLAFVLGIVIAQNFVPASRSGGADDINNTAGQSSSVNAAPTIPAGIGGNFTLYQGDQPVQLSDFKDKLVVMYFGFTSCPDVCPTTLVVISSALKELSASELDQIQPIFVSVDPERDQGDQLMAYATHFHPNFIGITGTPEEVQKVANQYGAFFIKTKSDSAMGYMVEHTSGTYLVRDSGKQVTTLPHEMTKSSLLEAIRADLQ